MHGTGKGLACGVLGMVAGWILPALAAGTHTVSVTLNYDFSVDNACSAEERTPR
jgi:hypothetical protein